MLVFTAMLTCVLCFLLSVCICLCHQSQLELVGDESLLIIKEMSKNKDQNQMHTDKFGSEEAETMWVVISAAV